MVLRRSKHTPVPKTIWEEKGAPYAAFDTKITKNTARTAQKTALKPVIAGPLPETIELNENDLPELPTYNPPLKLEFQASESLATGLSELDTFQQLLTPAIVDRIVVATNSYAANARKDEEPLPYARPWIPVNSTDIWRFIGCLLHMGYHKLANHEDYWSESSYLRQFISLRRYNQIHRYNSTKTDRPRLTLLVGPHAALCKPTQGPAQLRLSRDQAAPSRLRQLPDELSLTSRSLSTDVDPESVPLSLWATSCGQHLRMRGYG
jgi:Transposase IS4